MRRTLLDQIADYRRLRRNLKHLSKASTLDNLKVAIILGEYRKLFTAASVISSNKINALKAANLYPENLRGAAIPVLFYLSERVTVTPFHIINVITRDPEYAHSDAAALNRGLFESAVNVCYLLEKDHEERFKRFWLTSAKKEFDIQRSMDKWLNSKTESIKKRAEAQASIKDGTNEALIAKMEKELGDQKTYPAIYDRCVALGSEWAFFYDYVYRGLSAWQHGDVTRSFVAQSWSQIFPDQEERPVFESLAQCAWSWDMVSLHLKKLMDQDRDSHTISQLEKMDRKAQNVINENLAMAVHKFQIDE